MIGGAARVSAQDVCPDTSHAPTIASVRASGVGALSDGTLRTLVDGTHLVVVDPHRGQRLRAHVTTLDDGATRAVALDEGVSGPLREGQRVLVEAMGKNEYAECFARRVEGSWEIETGAMGILDVAQAQLGAGVLGWLDVHLRGPGPLIVRADVGPGGIALGTTGMFTGQAMLSLGLDSTFGSIAIGGGVMTPNTIGTRQDQTIVPVIGAAGRLVFADAALFEMRGSISIIDGQVDLAAAYARVQIFVTRDFYVGPRGTFSQGGNAFVLAGGGARIADDHHGNVAFLEVGLGGAGVWFRPGCAYGPCATTTTAIGPALELGLTIQTTP